MTVATLDLRALLKDVPKGAWAAISANGSKLIAIGYEVQEVVEKAAKAGEKHPIITRAPESAQALAL